MVDQDKKEFFQTITACGLMYDKELTQPLVKMYFQALSKFSLAEVIHGFSEHTLCSKHGSFFPKPANIASHIEKIHEPALSCEQRAELCWEEVMIKLEKIGPYGNLEMEDKQAMAAVNVIGWQKLNNSTYDQLVWIKKEFISQYSTYENAPLELIPAKISGLIEQDRDKKRSKLGNSTIENLLIEAKRRSES